MRKRTLSAIASVRELLAAGMTPVPLADEHCRACSLRDLCQPEAVQPNTGRGNMLTHLFDPES